MALWRVYFIILLFGISTLAIADTVEVPRPIFEYGVGGGGGFFQDYPASDQWHWRGIGFPYFIYRGMMFRADERGGASARMVATKKWTFDLSFTGSFPAASHDNWARQGMPDLDWIFELGPRLMYYFTRFKDGGGIAIRASARGLFSTNVSSLATRGIVMAPGFILNSPDFFGPNQRLVAQINFNFADLGVMQYFYEVPAANVTAFRPAYSAQSGYMGTDVNVGLGTPLNDSLRLTFYSRLSTYQGATNQSSPLFRQSTGWSVGIFLLWSIHRSDEVVAASDD